MTEQKHTGDSNTGQSKQTGLDDSKNNKTTNATTTTTTTNGNQKPPQQSKKNNNSNNSKTNKNNNKSRAKRPPPKQASKSKNNNGDDDESSTTTTSDDSDDDENKAKMPTYDDRYSEDNAILFGGKNKQGRGGGGGGARGRGRGRGRGGGAGRGQVEDSRPMLSGDVRLQSFPLGSQADCIKLAKEITALMNQKRFDGDINGMDIIKFVTYVIDGLVSKNSQHMDIVDINELKVQIDKLYNKKQKDMRAHKKKSCVVLFCFVLFFVMHFGNVGFVQG